MNAIDWKGIPLEQFSSKLVEQDDGTYNHVYNPYGTGLAQRIMSGLWSHIESAYEAVMSEEALDRWEHKGEVPVLRNGEWGYQEIQTFTFQDVPAVMDTLVELQEEHDRREREEKERLAAERKVVARVRAKERRKLKKLGEWDV